MTRKITILFLVAITCIAATILAGCGDKSTGSNTSNPKKITADSNTDDFENEDLPLDLKEGSKYVLVAIKSKYIVINSEDDFSNLKVAYIGDSDGEVYAKYYDFKEIGMYNAPNDLHSGITGKEYDVGLIDEDKISNYDDWEVVWEMNR